MSAYSPARDKPRTSNTGRPAAGVSLIGWWSNDFPVISSPRRWSVMPLASKVPSFSPLRSTVTRSAISSTSSSRWLTNTTATLRRFSSSVSFSSASTSRRVSEAVGSSMMTSRASLAMARQIATSCRWAIGSSATCLSGSIETPTRSIAAVATDRISAQRTGLSPR